MNPISTSAIMLRKTEYGDADLILTFLSKDHGKISVIAKNAKKSVIRFGGLLQLFSLLQIVIRPGNDIKPNILEEASMIRPFDSIKNDIVRIAYASYWAELLNFWMEENHVQESSFFLLEYVLKKLDEGTMPEIISIIFQIHFLEISGFTPNFNNCHVCKSLLDNIKHPIVFFEPKKGSIVCPSCPKTNEAVSVSKGAIKLMQFINKETIDKSERIKFDPQKIRELLPILESFVPYCIAKTPKSLKFLYDIRKSFQPQHTTRGHVESSNFM